MSTSQHPVEADFDNPEGTLPWSEATTCGQGEPTGSAKGPVDSPIPVQRLPTTGGDSALSRWALAGAALGGLAHWLRSRTRGEMGSR